MEEYVLSFIYGKNNFFFFLTVSKPISKGNVIYLQQISEEFLIMLYQGNIQL